MEAVFARFSVTINVTIKAMSSIVIVVTDNSTKEVFSFRSTYSGQLFLPVALRVGVSYHHMKAKNGDNSVKFQ